MNNLDPIAVSIADAVQLSGVGRSSIYEAIGRGDLTIRKRGRRSLVMVDDLRKWLENLPSHQTAVRAA